MDAPSSPLSALERTPSPLPDQTTSPQSSTTSSSKKRKTSITSKADSTSKGAEEETPRRSGRAAKRTYREEDTSEDELVQSSPPPKKVARMAAPTINGDTSSRTSRKQPLRGNFSPDHLLKNPRSVLADSNKITIRALLSHPTAWSALTRAEQLQLVHLLPGYTDMAWPDEMDIPDFPAQELSNNSTLRDACGKFQNDLADGRYTDAWLQKAQFAMKQRIRGTYDSWKERETEAFWGQKQKVDWNALAGDSGKYKLSDLVKARNFEKGDVWRFEIVRGKEASTQAKMIKEAVVTGVDFEEGRLSFKYPPGQHEACREVYAEGEEDKTLEGCDNPTPLLVKMMEVDGRVDAKERMNNAWKLVRLFRRKQDAGALFDLRERHAVKVEKGK